MHRAGLANYSQDGQSSCSQFFDRIQRCLENNTNQQLTHHMLHQQIGWTGSGVSEVIERRKLVDHSNYRFNIPEKPNHHARYQTQARSYAPQYSYKHPSRTERKSIQQELCPLVPLYTTYAPFHMSLEATPNPALPEFRNEFADIKVAEKARPEMPPPPPPARGNGPKNFCKFCKKNGEHPQKYMSHSLFNDNELACPILATHQCDNCKQIGHTRSYCPSPSANGASIVRMLSDHDKPKNPQSSH